MTTVLARPSFWTEPRDPWAWQRVLRRVADLGSVPDPWPAWEASLRGLVSRRAVAGLYGLKSHPRPGTWLGVGLLVPDGERWHVHPEAMPLIAADRGGFELELARWLVARSPWVRLALQRLMSGAWSWPRGIAPLHAARALRVGDDLAVGGPRVLARMDADGTGVGVALRVEVAARDLAPLHGPLYLLHALGWLGVAGRPSLPPALGGDLRPASAAELLRRICAEEADPGGYVALDRAARRLWGALYGEPLVANVATWTDRVFGEAIARGAIEVHDWSPGQPRHGRGLNGDRDLKLVRWTIHDDFFDPGEPR